MLEPPAVAPVAPVPPAAPATDHLQAEVDAALAVLRKPSSWGRGLVLVVSLMLFVLTQARSTNTPEAIAVLVGVLLFHEAGHFVGMRVFGYRDVRMFFIPFFGAAVSGKRGGVAAWKEGVVLLLGPVPGIALAFTLALLGLTSSPSIQGLAVSLLSINAFNLLPLSGLDGARMWQHVLFSRRRWLEIAFQSFAVAAMAAVAIALQAWVLGVMAYLMLVVLPTRWKVLGAARQLKNDGAVLPDDARDLDGEAARAVYLRARECTSSPNPRNVAPIMTQIVDATNVRPPSAAASVLLGAVWVAALFFAFVTLALVFRSDGTAAAPPPAADHPLQLQRPGLLDDAPVRSP